MKKIFVLIIGFIFLFKVSSQELRCNVQVVTQQIQGTNKQIFKTLQQAIYEFMNNRSWTNHVYDLEERIECNILINLTEQVGSDEFKGTMQVQSRRPVYNSSYTTVLLNYLDNDIDFTYIEFEPLEFNESTHMSNLTSILAYYAYLILGLDYDSFSFEGGTEFFQKAERIINNAQNASEKGWKAYESKEHKNRYWLLQNILDEEFSPVRDFYYTYHRLGLDIMDSKPSEGRTVILQSLEKLQEVKRKRPDPFMHLLRVVLDAKSDEFVNVFSEGSVEEKNRAFTILNEVDPSNASKFEKIKEQ